MSLLSVSELMQSYADEDDQIITALDEMYLRARAKKRQYYNQWRRNYYLLNAKMWSDSRSSWMPSPIDSEIYPIVSTLIAWMMDQSVSFSIAPAATLHTPFASYMQKLALDLQTILEANWEVENYRAPVQIGLWDAAVTGTAIYKTIWDGGLVDGLGNATIQRIDPWMFYPDPEATSLKDASYIIECKRMSLDEAIRRYPLAHKKIMRSLPYLMNAGTSLTSDQDRPFIYDNENRQLANPSALPGGTFQQPTASTSSGSFGLPGQSRLNWVNHIGIDVKECWVRENVIGEPPETDNQSVLSNDAPTITDRWRVIVYAGGIILMDELAEDLWESSRHPYERFCYDDTGEFWGISLVTHLSNPQIAINRTLAAVQQNAELSGNPILLEPANSSTNRQPITNRPGMRMEYSIQQSQAGKPEWLDPPQIPQYILELLKFWISRMENISGISGLAKGQAPAGRQSSSTITATQESGFVRIRAGQHNLENCLRNLGEMICHLITQNYTVPRTVAIVGPSGVKSGLSLASKHFYSPYRDASGQRLLPLRFSLVVTAGAKNPTSRSARISESDTLFALGAIDAQALLEAHNYPEWQAITQRMNQQKLQMALAGELAKANKGPNKRVKAAGQPAG